MTQLFAQYLVELGEICKVSLLEHIDFILINKVIVSSVSLAISAWLVRCIDTEAEHSLISLTQYMKDFLADHFVPPEVNDRTQARTAVRNCQCYGKTILSCFRPVK